MGSMGGNKRKSEHKNKKSKSAVEGLQKFHLNGLMEFVMFFVVAAGIALLLTTIFREQIFNMLLQWI